MQQVQASTITTLRNLGPNQHVICLGGSPARLHSLLKPFVLEGISRREPCLLLHDLYSFKGLLASLQQNGLDLAGNYAQGLLTLLPSLWFFRKEGCFSPKACLGRLLKAGRANRNGGEIGLRVVVDMNWAATSSLHADDLLAYEMLVNQVLMTRLPVTMVCLYDRALFSPGFLTKLLAVHPTVLEPHPRLQREEGANQPWLTSPGLRPARPLGNLVCGLKAPHTTYERFQPCA